MMPSFTLHNLETAPEDSRPILQEMKERFGFIPNLAAYMAESPPTLKAYTQTYALLRDTDFTPAEQQLIFLAISRANGCQYCVAAHSTVGKMAGLDMQTIQAVRDGKTVLDSKYAAIVEFATKVVETRGHVSQDDILDFLAAGHSQAQILEILMATATKTISNYMNHIAKTPLDSGFAPMAYTPVAYERDT